MTVHAAVVVRLLWWVVAVVVRPCLGATVVAAAPWAVTAMKLSTNARTAALVVDPT